VSLQKDCRAMICDVTDSESVDAAFFGR